MKRIESKTESKPRMGDPSLLGYAYELLEMKWDSEIRARGSGLG